MVCHLPKSRIEKIEFSMMFPIINVNFNAQMLLAINMMHSYRGDIGDIRMSINVIIYMSLHRMIIFKLLLVQRYWFPNIECVTSLTFFILF